MITSQVLVVALSIGSFTIAKTPTVLLPTSIEVGAIKYLFVEKLVPIIL